MKRLGPWVFNAACALSLLTGSLAAALNMRDFRTPARYVSGTTRDGFRVEFFTNEVWLVWCGEYPVGQENYSDLWDWGFVRSDVAHDRVDGTRERGLALRYGAISFRSLILPTAWLMSRDWCHPGRDEVQRDHWKSGPLKDHVSTRPKP